jgi:orotate phosphoribosyltransferase
MNEIGNQIVDIVSKVSVMLILVLLAVKTVVDELQAWGWWPGIRAKKLQEEERRIRLILGAQEEIIQQKEQLRAEQLLQAIGIIDKRELAYMRQAVEFINTIEALAPMYYEEQLRLICAQSTIDQAQITDKRFVYGQFRYYIDLTSPALYIIYGEKLAEILQALITRELQVLRSDLDESIYFDKVAIPREGNIALGLLLANRLKKPLVVVTTEPRIIADQFWHGSVEPDDRLILVNDIAVSGRRLGESVQTLRKYGQAQINHVFVLIERTESNAQEVLASYRRPIHLHSLLELDDNGIEELVKAHREDQTNVTG